MNTILLTFEEARKYLRINKSTLYKLIHSGNLPAFRVGKQWRIDKKGLNNWLQKQKASKK